MPDLGCILLVEDDPHDAELTMTALAANNFASPGRFFFIAKADPLLNNSLQFLL
jgi:hypothetical protein